MKKIILISLILFSILFSLNEALYSQTREEIISGIEKGLIDMYIVQVSYYSEFNQYSNSLNALGIDTVTYQNYWDIRLYSFKEGFVIEARGIKSPVLGEMRSIDERGVVVGGR